MKANKNTQIKTTWLNNTKQTLNTGLIETSIRQPMAEEILVEMVYVPVHGSFWLATNPQMTHPRIKEFMENDGFVFGNGGVGKVLAVGENIQDTLVGDFVAIFGHTPCKHQDCGACYARHRYVECDYGEGKIIGHGKQSGDGTYARFATLPKYSYEVCSKKDDPINDKTLKALMYSFLLADVRNALTRNDNALNHDTVIIFGAGQSGLLAIHLILKTNDRSKILLIDIDQSRLEHAQKIDNQRIFTYHLNQKNEQTENINLIAKQIEKVFSGKKAGLIFDASSGNSAPLWANTKILGPNCLVIVFGFGSLGATLDNRVFQLSGLEILMSRGVGNLENRKEVVRLIKSNSDEFINRNLTEKSIELVNLKAAMDFISRYQGEEGVIPQAYIKFDTH